MPDQKTPAYGGQAVIEGVMFGGKHTYVTGPLIKRVFQYHGAEHKVINTFENGLPLTVENVQKNSRLHYRCRSSYGSDLWLQLVTTKEPTNEQVEVSIASFQEMLKRDEHYENQQQAKIV